MKGAILSVVWLAGLTVAQSSSASVTPSVITLSGSQRSLTGDDAAPNPTVPSDFEGSTFATITSPASSGPSGSIFSANGTASLTSTQDPVTNIGGGNRTLTPTGTGTAPALPSNTQPCNNYLEFCSRKYSNITEVAAHNSPYTRQNNIARNQEYGVTQQLNDGIRMLQGSAHYVNGTLYYCHSSCDLLNAGTVEDYLREVTAWVEAHPFDVITILFGNSNWDETTDDGKPLVTSSNFADPIEKSGLIEYVYQPPKTAMELDDWPTLGELILHNNRVITFIDYNFDTNAVPYMLWEFYNMWETPFSPTDPDFPCTLGRPEGMAEEKMRDIMYMANHNLNAEISFAGLNLLVPNVAQINQTNGLEGEGSLGAMTNTCTTNWDRPPNFLLVDFYNQGPINGSVFEVAARANNVTYDRECCGTTSVANVLLRPSATYFGFVVAIAAALVL
ncbi:putative secreted protein [Alternaria arborescens]|uniref:Putative secreted protein n=1 Tax=Alternaria arborescens TaxID=156630 RepID=A0A4Q4RFF0_9PLEO|nr:putative secreted protein [Alternaria arborescens]RYN22847.1 putative secreted protein [Alternaria arborescens]RYO32412.1 putative secreted protein [Alternaria arborescens]RYO55409.1 putative secreted protein [Alternaria arborescens]